MFSKHLIIFGLLLLLIFALLGSGSYAVFYDELVVRWTGEGIINWERIAAICGWAGSPGPGESLWGYRIRSTWNMISAQMGMTAIYVGMMLLFYFLVRLVFWFTEKRTNHSS